MAARIHFVETIQKNHESLTVYALENSAKDCKHAILTNFYKWREIFATFFAINVSLHYYFSSVNSN